MTLLSHKARAEFKRARSKVSIVCRYPRVKRRPCGKPYFMRVSQGLCGAQLNWGESPKTVTQKGFQVDYRVLDGLSHATKTENMHEATVRSQKRMQLEYTHRQIPCSGGAFCCSTPGNPVADFLYLKSLPSGRRESRESFCGCRKVHAHHERCSNAEQRRDKPHANVEPERRSGRRPRRYRG